MATENNELEPESTQNRWKYRYYDVLDDLENKEKNWRELERFLRQLISRLTLAADTRNPPLTRQLTELRNHIRDGKDLLSLQSLTEEITDNVAKLDELRAKHSSNTHPASMLETVIDKLKLPIRSKRSVNKLKKQLSKLQVDDDATTVIDEFTALISNVLSNQNAPPISGKDLAERDDDNLDKPRIGLLDRLLHRKNKDVPPEQQQPDVIEQTIDGTPGEPATAKPSNTLKFVAPAAGELLLQLALRLPDTVKQRINFRVLKKHTNKARTRKDLLPIIDVIANQIETAYKVEEQVPVLIDNDSLLAIAGALQSLLEQVEPPFDLQAAFHEIYAFFSNEESNADGMVHCLNRLSDFIAELCDRLAKQQLELESFFDQLNARLQDLDTDIRHTTSFYQASEADANKMDNAVHDEMSVIRESMEGENELTLIKQSVTTRLDAIDEHLKAFRNNQEQRYHDAQQHIEQLTDKLQMLEQEGSRLREKLEQTQQQARYDALTGVHNRQAYEEYIAEELARVRRYNTPLSMIVWDVDKFKSINDTYGHAAGDKVLKTIAETLNNNCRETDFLGRYGGEEFVMLLPETDLANSLSVADKLRERIAQTEFHFRDTRVLITISAGVAQYQNEESVHQFFERADNALYSAKQAGRNQVAHAD